MRHALVLGPLGGHGDRPLHDRVVLFAGTLGYVGVREVRKPQQQITQLTVGCIGSRGEFGLTAAEAPALGHHRLGLLGPAIAAELTDLLGELVDLAAEVVAVEGEQPQPLVDRRGLLQLGEQISRPAAGHRGANALGVGTKQANVDHG